MHGHASSDHCPDHYIAHVRLLIATGLKRGKPDSAGYVYHTVGPTGGKMRFAEHVVVMEHVLGRRLHPFEEVHHKNGIRHDNAASNLELWTKSQPAGQRPEDLVAWVLDNYEDLVEQELSSRRRARAAL